MNLIFNSFLANLIPGAGFVWVFALRILTAIVHIGFALAVLKDSQMLQTHLRRKTFFVGGGLWALATLLGGVFVAAIYWSIHHSTLRPQQPTSASRVEPESPTTPK